MIWVTYWANPEGEQEIMGGQTLLPQGKSPKVMLS
jgi:hypothetical protein